MSLWEMIKGFLTSEDVSNSIFYIAGLAILAVWMLKNSLGTKALTLTKPRKNSLNPFAPLAVLFAYYCTATLAFETIKRCTPKDYPEPTLKLIQTCSTIALAFIFAAIVLFIAHKTFAAQIKGFGIRFKTIHKDIGHALLNYICIITLVFAAAFLTEQIGRYFIENFKIEPHNEITKLTTFANYPLLIAAIFINAIIAAPIIEEFIFRGLFQSTIRAHINKPWTSIALTSMLFASVHANPWHWPALFVLSMAIGYSYEKSNSILRPVFIHMTFNAVSISIAYYQALNPQ